MLLKKNLAILATMFQLNSWPLTRLYIMNCTFFAALFRKCLCFRFFSFLPYVTTMYVHTNRNSIIRAIVRDKMQSHLSFEGGYKVEVHMMGQWLYKGNFSLGQVKVSTSTLLQIFWQEKKKQKMVVYISKYFLFDSRAF